MYLFDFDGTLVDSNGVWVEIDNGFLARRGLTPTREYSDTVGHSIFPIAAQFTKDYYHLDMTPRRSWPGAPRPGSPWPFSPPAYPSCAGPPWPATG